MALRYYVSTYRPPTCSNIECADYGKIISIDVAYVPHAEIGESWRTFCPTCGDGTGWTLNKVEWDPLIQIDEIKIDMKIQILSPEPMTIPTGDGADKPYWQHDCDKCVYLGSRDIGYNRYDFYYCESSKSDENNFTGIIRDGNLPEDNSSYLSRSIAEWDGTDEEDVCNILKNLILKHTFSA